jgi:hypothetical protein
MIDCTAPMISGALKTTPYAAGSNSRVIDNHINIIE